MGGSGSKRVKPSDGASLLENKYRRGHLLGVGGFSQVWSCKETATGRTFACKAIKKELLDSPEHKAALASEVQVMKRIQGKSPHFIQLHEVIENESEVYIIMEKCQGGDLYYLLRDYGALPEPAVRLVFRQLASAVRCLHSLGIIHRDIKIRNILFDKSPTELYSWSQSARKKPQVQAKLSDFGLSVMLSESNRSVSGCVGTLRFSAPELLQGLPYNFAVDLWSMGVVLCTMLTGKNPFAGRGCEEKGDIIRAIAEGRVEFTHPCWRHVSREAKDLVRQLLQVDPQNRITAEGLLNHPWLRCEEDKH